MSDPTDENTFTAIAEQALTTSYVEYRYTIPASTTNTYLVIMIDAANANRTSNGVYIDDIVIPTCPVPTDLTYTNVSTNSATLSWTPGGEESNWVLEYSTEYDFTGATSVPVSGDATETLNSLTSGTVYYVRVKADCGDGDTSDWISTTFTTQCDFVTTFPWSENFDDYYSGEFYELCWVNEHISGNGSYNFRISTYASGSNETHTIYLNRMAVGTQTKLVLPAMDLPNANYQFVIDAYRSSADASYAAEGIKVYASTNGEIEGATELAFISLYYGATDNNHIPAEEASGWYTYELPIGVSGPCYIILYGESQNLGTFYMDNFVVKVIPTCPVPTALTVSAVTANSATLSWTSGGNENNWVLEYGTASDFTGATSVDVSDNATTTLEGLTSGATYYARVKADCGNDDTSEWSTSVSFTTECVAITVDAQHSWTEDFESYEGFGFDENGDMPYCWESYNTANNSTLPHVFTFSIPEWYVHQGSNALILTGGLSFVVLPEFTNPLDELQISFWMKAQMQNYGKFELGYITDEEVTDIYNQFIPLGYSYYTNIPTEMTQMNIYLDIIPADAKRLAFCWSSNNNYACFIDDVEVSLMPEGVSTCDSRPALGYMEDFNSYYAINNVLPICWNRINTSTDSPYCNYPSLTSSSEDNTLYFASYAQYNSNHITTYDPQPQYAILPPMSDLAGKQVTLLARCFYANSTFKIGTMSDPTDENTFTAIAEQALTTSYVEYRYTIPASTTNTYLVIMIDAANANRTSNGVYIDDIVIPTCPVPTDLTYTNVSTNSATLSWTPGGEESNWVLEYSTEYDFTGATSVPVSGDATETLNSLTSGTVYYVRVKADCGDGDTSDWISTTFTTQCDFVTTFPWSENFDDYYSGEFYELCWVNEHISGNGSYNFRISTYASGSNETHTIYLNRMAVGTQTKLVLPAMDLPNANYQFVIDAYRSSADASYAAEGIKVYASTNGEIEGATELAFISLYYGATDNNHIPAEEASGWYTYELPIGVSGPCYIILYGESQNLGTFYMDNFVVKVIPTCPVPTALTVSAVTANSATLSWTSGGNENNWVLEYGTASDFTGATSVDVSDNATTTLEGLTSGATYYARVKADCGNDDTSEWSTSVSFTTECVAITVDAQHSWTEDFESYEGFGFDENGDMPYCWESYNTANNSTLPHVFTFSIPEWYVHQGSNALILTGGLSFVVLPEFTNPLDELQISFWMKAQMQNYGKFELGYITDEEVTDIYNQFIPLGYSYYTNIPTEMTQMNIYLDIIPADAKRLAFCWSSNNNYACFIDDVEVSLMPEGVSTCDSRPALGYMEDFNSYYAINNVLPICWNRINTSTDSPYCNYPSLTSSSEDNTLYFASYAQYNSNHITTYDPQPQYAILPPMSDLAGKQVTLLARCFYANSTFKIGTMSDPTDENTFTAFAEQALTTSYVEYRYTIPANTTNTYLVIMIDAADESRNGIDVYIDDISITNPPTSEMPIALSAGWNWWAPMVQITAEQLRSAISGIAIYSKESENNVVADDVNLEPGQMYKLQTDDAIENVSVTGILTTPVNSISAGTNWIGYTGETAVIATALNTLDITPSDGDKIISQDGGFAIYNGTAWEGTLTSLEQGKGYVYVRPSTE